MKSRMVQKTMFSDYRAICLSPEAKLFLVALMCAADDEGNVKLDLKGSRTKLVVKAGQTTEELEAWVRELTDAEFLSPYEVEAQPYASIVEWNDRNGLTFQKIAQDKKAIWRNPTPNTSETKLEEDHVLGRGSRSDAGGLHQMAEGRRGSGNRRVATTRPGGIGEAVQGSKTGHRPDNRRRGLEDGREPLVNGSRNPAKPLEKHRPPLTKGKAVPSRGKASQSPAVAPSGPTSGTSLSVGKNVADAVSTRGRNSSSSVSRIRHGKFDRERFFGKPRVQAPEPSMQEVVDEAELKVMSVAELWMKCHIRYEDNPEEQLKLLKYGLGRFPHNKVFGPKMRDLYKELTGEDWT